MTILVLAFNLIARNKDHGYPFKASEHYSADNFLRQHFWLPSSEDDGTQESSPYCNHQMGFGWGFCKLWGMIRVNTDIYSWFVASLLDFNVSKHLIVHLTEVLFPQLYLGGLDEVVDVVVPYVGIPIASELRLFVDHGEVFPWLPFVSSFKTMTLTHRDRVWHASDFLLHLHFLIPSDGVSWYTDFRDYIFPLCWILMNLLALMAVKIFVESDFDYRGGEDDEEDEDEEEGWCPSLFLILLFCS